ncbi:MAG TPA: hypothetical protein VEQ16_07260 [Acidocella sp.]|jgi:hypothetical protein|nr:hypothetical protein [Acidocella sp.]
MKQKMEIFTGAACLLLFSAGLAFATDPHSTANPTGQPSQSCQATNPPNFPGGSGSSPGSAFNGKAGTEYAGTPGTPSALNNNSPNGVAAQYDVACFQQTQRIP